MIAQSNYDPRRRARELAVPPYSLTMVWDPDDRIFVVTIRSGWAILAARTPARLKLRRGETKWILKQLARRRGLPEHLVTRRKQGFGIPVGEWFRGELRPWIEDVLQDPACRERGWFAPTEVDRLLTDHLERRADHTPRLWSLAMLELWQREWIDGR